MEDNLFDLSGKTALVTGGSRGIGFAIAKGLAEYGADVAIIARNRKQLREAKEQIENSTSKKVWIFPFDLRNLDRIFGLFEEIVNKIKEIDILVNCAGTTIRGPSEDVDLASWNKVIKVNLSATFMISQAFCQPKKKVGKGGKIINIGSLTCQAARPTTAAYASSKGGLLSLTKTLAVEWAKYNINVNAIGPGYIVTELNSTLKADEEFNNWVISKTPLGRWGQPDDLIGTAILLASHAGDFITGQIIYVDGGWLALL
jgi:gluconate 5-dehydrogenase